MDDARHDRQARTGCGIAHRGHPGREVDPEYRCRAGNLPYLAFALDLLFTQRDDTSLSEQSYNAFGGVSGAITEHVRDVEATLRKQQGKKRIDTLLPQLFQALVVVEKENLPVRSQVAKSAFADDLKPVVEMLIDERLLSTEGEGENNKVSVAHEKLFQGWPALERWISDNQNDLWMKGRLAIEAREWAQALFRRLCHAIIFFRSGSLCHCLEPVQKQRTFQRECG